MIAFLLMNIAVILAAFQLTYKIFKLDRLTDSLAILFILFLSQIVISQTILGLPGALTLKNTILLNLAILFIVWLACRKRKYCFNYTGIKEASNKLLASKVITLCLSVIIGFATAKVVVNLLNPPFGWDSLNYHFTFAVEWLKHGNLNMPITISDDPSPTYYPINGSLFFLWLIWPLKSVFLADLGQLPFFILAFISTYSICRKINITEKASFFAAALILLTPNYFKQLQIAYVDVMVSALFLACVNFLFLLNEKFSGKNIFAYSMAFGLLLGTKTVALPYCLLLAIPLIYLLYKNVNKAYLVLIFFITVVCLGGFSYLRNFIETNNPLYPLDLKLFGREIFKGVMDSGVYRARFKISDYALGKLLFHEGLGVQTLIFVFPALFLALPLSLIKNKGRLKFIKVYLLALPILLYLVYRYLIPLANTRYLYSALAIGMIAGFYLIKELKLPEKVINLLVIISVLASMPELAKRQELISAFILTFLLLLFMLFTIRRGLLNKIAPIAIFLFFTILCILPIARQYYQKNEFKNYLKMVKYSGFSPDATKAWAWLEQNTQADNIAYVGRPVPFPLYGSNFKNNVYYVSLNSTDPAKLHYFPHSCYKWGADASQLHKSLEEDGNYRGGADYSIWLNNLIKRNTGYLFVYSLHQTQDIDFPIEDKWATDSPTRFILVFRNQTIRIYKIAKALP